VLAVLCLLALQGCAAVALTAGSLAASAGISHTLNGIAYKTFTMPLGNMRVATLKTLNRMGIKVTKSDKAESGWEIQCEAADRTIEIELEALTPKTTRMRVVANQDAFFKDSATATEIILQTARTLDQQVARVGKREETKLVQGDNR
jgi:hypothetical protein